MYELYGFTPIIHIIIYIIQYTIHSAERGSLSYESTTRENYAQDYIPGSTLNHSRTTLEQSK